MAEVHDACVPNQLLPKADSESAKEDEGTEDVNEFSGVGAIAGYSGPLGMDPDKLGRKKNKPRNK